MNKPKSESGQMADLFILILVVIVFLAMIAGAVFWPKYECDAATRDIGYPHRWSFVAGCQIEVEDGRWIPLDSYYFRE